MNGKVIGLSLLLLLLPVWADAQEGLLDRLLESGLGPALPFSAEPGSPQMPPPDDTPTAPEGESGQHAAPPVTEEVVEGEVLPGPGERVLVPLSNVGVPGDVQFQEHGDRISLVVRDASLSYVLALLAERRGLNIVAANDIDALVSMTLHEKTVEEALTAILSVANYTWTEHHGIIYVTSLAQSASLPPDLQGRRIQVFPLDYVSAQDLLLAVQSFLSPVGQAFVSESDSQDTRRTRETLVVEDVPFALERIAAFVHQMDQPPRQVLIEAHILEVDLEDNRQHGVNFDLLFETLGNTTRVSSLMGNGVSLLGSGLTQPGSGPGFFASVNGDDLDAIVQLLKTTTDAKTLASPRLLVVNEQRARLQVGEQLGYRQTTTTETSTNEGVAFLDVGVILEITPRITRDNRVLLQVRPEVSGGQIVDGLPNSDTAHLETNVLLDDGYGVVIGGLIQETDSVVQNKVPYLGDLYLIGKLFQRQEVEKSRREIIVVLTPRIYPYACDYAAHEQGNVVRAETDLFEGPLLRKDRPWAPKLPDAVANPRILRLPPVGKVYPYPARRIEYAATPQPQRRFPVPGRPGPATTQQPAVAPSWAGASPNGPAYQPPAPPVVSGSSETVVPDSRRPYSGVDSMPLPPPAPTPAGP